MWSDEPPKDGGWCWLRKKSDKQESVCERFDDGEWWIRDVEWDEAFVARHYQFGPRIPSPEELEAERRAYNEALVMIGELRRELAELKKGGA